MYNGLCVELFSGERIEKWKHWSVCSRVGLRNREKHDDHVIRRDFFIFYNLFYFYIEFYFSENKFNFIIKLFIKKTSLFLAIFSRVFSKYGIFFRIRLVF